MRILELSDLYEPAVGGLERYVALLASALQSRGHTVAVATATVPSLPAGLCADGPVPVYRIKGWAQAASGVSHADSGRPFHPTFPDPGTMAGLQDVIKDFRPDVIHSHSWNLFSVLPVAHRLGVPVMVHAHDYGLVCPRKTLMLPDGSECSGPASRCFSCSALQYGTAKGAVLTAGLTASAHLLRQVTTFTAVSGYVAERLSAMLPARTGRQVEVLHSFVPDGLDDLAAAVAPADYLPEGEFILFAGQLSAHKGVHVLLEAYGRMRNRPPLVLLGTPHPTMPRSEDLPEDVILRTDVPHPAMMSAMRRATVTVIPSLWGDPFPMTVSEAQLCGGPVVASAVGGIPEQILHRETGLLVPPGEPDALRGCLDELLQDPSRRRRLADAGRSWARRFTESGVIDRTTALLRQTAEAVR